MAEPNSGTPTVSVKASVAIPIVEISLFFSLDQINMYTSDVYLVDLRPRANYFDYVLANMLLSWHIENSLATVSYILAIKITCS